VEDVSFIRQPSLAFNPRRPSKAAITGRLRYGGRSSTIGLANNKNTLKVLLSQRILSWIANQSKLMDILVSTAWNKDWMNSKARAADFFCVYVGILSEHITPVRLHVEMCKVFDQLIWMLAIIKKWPETKDELFKQARSKSGNSMSTPVNSSDEPKPSVHLVSGTRGEEERDMGLIHLEAGDVEDPPQTDDYASCNGNVDPGVQEDGEEEE